MPNQDTTRTRPSLRLEPLAKPVDRKEDDATGINVEDRADASYAACVKGQDRYALWKNISRKGPRNCRSLGFARDDKG
jgi:hypothetical protein